MIGSPKFRWPRGGSLAWYDGSAGEALRNEFLGTQPNRIQVSWAEIEVPAVAAGERLRVSWAEVEVPGASGVIPGVNVWTGAAWEAKPMKVWSGSAWVTKPVKRFNGSVWV